MRGNQENQGKKHRKSMKKGMKEGIEQNKHDVVVNALHMKLSFKTIQKLTGLSLESISSIAQSIAMA